MIYIILSICCSVTVAVLLKLAKRYQISVIQAVTVNYFIALSLCFLFFKPDVKLVTSAAPWPIYIALAILLPSIFLFLAASVKKLGIVKTDIAQRLSLFIPILAAYFLFKEDFNQFKVIGLAIGFVAIVLTFLRKSDHQKTGKESLLYPIMVFVGFGFIDVLFKQIALYKELPYTTSLFTVFGLAFIVSIILVIAMVVAGKTKLQLINVVCGFILGLFNFGNILFYMKAHKALANNPSTVFAAMNLGVIILGTLIGLIVFKEKLSKLNYTGIILAIAAVIFITLSQHAVR
ncbi:EamA-like transporter family protein [Pedobacter suwonensis]|uniref:EamA-like transporter family protein n=1 Tax=Pedobacter suwonensis TaxID=332999 RepID=A0A1I0SE93_9SPHI|nr:DMT family transporter [Pedobacter suwonensis]SFA37815.1 EamA-like transporter family protein [Pedobacter suwonensis]